MVQYKTTSTTLPSVGALIGIMFGLGSGLMFVAIWLGANVWVSMIALMAPMFFSAAFFGGSGFYWIDEKGIGRTIKARISYRKLNSSVQEYFTWKEVSSFKHGKDLNRSMQEYEYLEIKLPGARVWQITDKDSKPEFAIFRDEFLSRINAYNATAEPVQENPAAEAPHPAKQYAGVGAVTTASTQHAKIEQEKTFYERPIAHILFWTIAAVVGYLAFFLIQTPGYLKPTYIFRFAFVLGPGLAYFFYRLYVKKK